MRIAPLRLAADGWLSLLLAPPCAACGGVLEFPSRGPVCAACWAAIRILTPPLCERCGDPLPSWRVISQARARCPRCRRRPSSIDRGAAVGVYDGTLRDVIHALKYEGRRTLARPLGGLMAKYGAALIEGADCAVPVPLHRRRLRARGFNQAAELARALGLPVMHALVRIRATVPQTELPAARRHRNVEGAFRVAGPRRFGRRRGVVRGRTILLVDDVCTTGATLEACATVLKAAGAVEVRALTAARVVLPRP
jgi:ComF family protein